MSADLHLSQEEIKREIQKFFKGDFLDDPKTLDTYSHDASLLEVRPRIVLFPKDAEDIEKVVEFVAAHKAQNPELSVTARAAGTCMSGGPLNESIIIDVTKYMRGTLAVGDLEATVLPGTYYRDFEKETLQKGLLLPSYTASKNLCAIGGMVANNSGGEKTLQYGKTEDYVKELKVVFADGKEYVVKLLTKSELDQKMAQGDFEGNLYKKLFELVTKNEELLKAAKPKVSKNSAGYYLWNVWDGTTFNLNKLLVGSQGTLGIVTEVKFKLVPVKEKSKLFVIFLKELEHVSEIVNEILPFHPESLETYDDQTLKLAIRFFPGILKVMKAKNFIKLGLSFLPELWMILTGGMPKLIMLAEFSGEDEAKINETMLAVDEKLKRFKLKTRITKSLEESEKYWAIRRESFNLLRKHIKGKRTAPFIDDVIVRPEHLPKFIPQLTAILDSYHLTYTIAGHAGDGNFHIIPLMDMHDGHNRDIITEVSDKVYDLVLSYGGSITAEHNDGIIRTPYLPKMYGEKVYDLFKQTKNIFDPQNIFNPGKKVGGSVEYIHEHIVKG